MSLALASFLVVALVTTADDPAEVPAPTSPTTTQATTEATTPPTTQVPTTQVPTTGETGLRRADIQSVVQAVMGDIKRCYERELGKDPNLQGRFVTFFLIGADGTVIRGSTHSSTFVEPTVEACTLSIIQRLRFPPPRGGGVVNVTYPFVFAASGGPSPPERLRVEGPLPYREVEAVLQGSVGPLQACLAQRADPFAPARASVELLILDGDVKRVALSESNIEHEPTRRCVQGIVKSLRFRDVDGHDETLVRWPLLLLPANPTPSKAKATSTSNTKQSASRPSPRPPGCGWN